jgi:hypothetical protein
VWREVQPSLAVPCQRRLQGVRGSLPEPPPLSVGHGKCQRACAARCSEGFLGMFQAVRGDGDSSGTLDPSIVGVPCRQCASLMLQAGALVGSFIDRGSSNRFRAAGTGPLHRADGFHMGTAPVLFFLGPVPPRPPACDNSLFMGCFRLQAVPPPLRHTCIRRMMSGWEPDARPFFRSPRLARPAAGLGGARSAVCLHARRRVWRPASGVSGPFRDSPPPGDCPQPSAVDAQVELQSTYYT